MKRLMMRSPFEMRLPAPRREGEATLLYPFDPRIAWVAACHHRTSSRISWDLFSSPAVRLEPLFAELLPALQADDRLPAARTLRFSVDLGSTQDFEAGPLQLRGVVKNALLEALASRGVPARPRAAGRWSVSISASAHAIAAARAWRPAPPRSVRPSRRS